MNNDPDIENIQYIKDNIEKNSKICFTYWQKYIDKKKLLLLTKITNIQNIDNTMSNSMSNTLDNSPEHKVFINILKSIIKCKLFNISNIIFMLLKFLESSYIESAIICNTIDVYNKDIMYNNINVNNYYFIDNNLNPDVENTLEKDIDTQYEFVNQLDIYINTIQTILSLLIDLVVYIEISLNLHCILIVNCLQQISNLNTQNTQNTSIYNSSIFNYYKSLNNNISKNIKPSTVILLFLKIIRKLGIFELDRKIKDILVIIENDTTQNDTTQNDTNYIYKNKFSKLSKELKASLDTFILQITIFFDNENKNNDDKEQSDKDYKELYIIFNNYIINITKLLFNSIENVFDLLDKYILNNKYIIKTKSNKYNVDEINQKKEKFIYMKNTFKNLLDFEVNEIIEKFKIIK